MKKSYIIPLQIEKDSYKPCIEFLNTVSKDEECIFFIDSNGGDANSAFKIGNKILEGYQVKAYVLAGAFSAAFIILQCCKIRIANRTAKFLLHFPKYANGSTDFAQLKGHYVFLKYLSNRTGHSIRFLWEHCRKDSDITAEEALKLNFIDEIIEKK